jgi:hypothetical protein
MLLGREGEEGGVYLFPHPHAFSPATPSTRLLFHFVSTFSVPRRSMSLFTYLTRPQLPKHPLGPRDTEQEAAEHLLHFPSPSSSSSPPTSNAPPTPRCIVLRTLLVSTAIYLAALAALAYSVRHTPFVVDADEFCIGHVVQYCASPHPLSQTPFLLLYSSLPLSLLWSWLLTVWCRLAAPLVRHVRPAWHSTRFNGSFLHENVYRQAAGDEVDAAWAALGVDCELAVPRECRASAGPVC